MLSVGAGCVFAVLCFVGGLRGCVLGPLVCALGGCTPFGGATGDQLGLQLARFVFLHMACVHAALVMVAPPHSFARVADATGR